MSAKTKPAKKDTIFETAQTLFAYQGYAAVSILDIAKKAGVAKSTVFHHFRSKKRLYTLIMAENFKKFNQVVTVPVTGTPLQKSQQIIGHLFDWMCTEPIHAKLTNRGFMDNPSQAGSIAQRYWLPFSEKIESVLELDSHYHVTIPETRLFIILLINSIIQFTFSIETQREILAPGKRKLDNLFKAYGDELNEIIRLRLSQFKRRKKN